ncbi:ABC transporter ATP-binding protein [Bradyrhizobium xenonodulans]|uniref:Spermidine/putrescine import ATP-binding protein PotA n=1 Tax=Bradyrhizobium xenonodulans TaxID=2736875 RepID=A0ABY7MGU9_9BRAD|nr:ABC transporter ATP-binding protein [Bradyrhizobium xenonodulans]WBL76773.1 ABC transporter ATP-binding protein [Bradyrhizobium xenonodulans]
MSYLSLRGLSKVYGLAHAVRDLDLDVERGEFLSLLGPSGCGKTTTLQMVAGFVPPTAGTVVVGGRDLTEVAPEKRDMGVVFQSYALFPHMTVRQNIAFGLEMRKLARTQLDDRVEEALSMVRLSGFGDRYPSQLSGGQRQRVAIARSLAIQPSVLLLDEPMSNLDAKLRGEMHVELRALQRRLGITTVLVTHDQVEAMTMSDRIAVMTNGSISQLGSPHEIYDKPASEFVYKFLGHANVITGEITSRNHSSAVVRVGSTTFSAAISETHVGSEIELFVRPERLRIMAADASNVRGRVNTRLFLGGLWLFEIESDIGALRVTTQNLGMEQPQEGEVVGIGWNHGDLRIVASEQTDG